MASPTAVEREAAWLSSHGDGLPGLLTGAGGPFDLVVAYWPRTPEARKCGVYVTRSRFSDLRFGAHRRIRRHSLLLKVVWPIGSTTVQTQLWENEQRALDLAVDQVVQRIVDLDGDKTHGGRFLSVAEAPEAQPIDVQFPDPERMPATGRAELRAEIRYQADDTDYTS